MFSTDTTSIRGSFATSRTGHNPRRRQRETSNDSLAVRHQGQSKRRKRSALEPETFEPLTTTAESKANGNGGIHHQSHGVPRGQSEASTERALSFRHRSSRRGESRRPGDAEGGVVLTKDDNYVVTEVPTIPDKLREMKSSERWNGDISTKYGYALAMTQNQALVWRYDVGGKPSDANRPSVIKLPYQSNNIRHPLPLGILVQDTSASELALLVVIPITGRVVYWESVSNAASVDLVSQKRQGLQGTIAGLMSGEIITKITEAELDGFILTMSSGRVAHLAVRDNGGKPAIVTQYLRGNGIQTVGFLGGLKSVFSTANWKRDIAAVKALPSNVRSQSEVVVATTKGVFQVWDLTTRGPKSLAFESNARDDLLMECRASGPTNEESLEVLDFSFYPGARHDKNGGRGYRLLILCVSTTDDRSSKATYTLHDLIIRNGSTRAKAVYPMKGYSTLYPAEEKQKPSLFLPDIADTAFVTFDTSVVLMNVAEYEESPTTQLRVEAAVIPDPFQATIDFRKGVGFHIVGCNSELPNKSSGESSCLLLVHGYGMIRILCLPAKDGQSASERTAVTAKANIEQAIFFGSVPRNPLDFSGRPETFHDRKAIEKAAIEINDSILDSSSSYLPQTTPSMEHQLEMRAAALADLIKYLTRNEARLSKLTRWKLLWSAEKMASARAVWASYNELLSHQENILAMPQLLNMLSEKLKHENQPDKGETDIVRHYLIHDVGNIEWIIPWAQNVIELLYKQGRTNAVNMVTYTSQGCSLQIALLETAYAFREDSANLYGIDKRKIEDGVYKDDYESLPEFWTSILRGIQGVKLQIEVSRELVCAHDTTVGDEDSPSVAALLKLGAYNPRLIDLFCRTGEERCLWLGSQTNSQDQAEARMFRKFCHSVRLTMITKLVEIHQPHEAIKLAEKYGDMRALVETLFKSTLAALKEINSGNLSDDDEDDQQHTLESNKELETSFFHKYDAPWAEAFYEKLISIEDYAGLMNNLRGTRQLLTQFLRSRPQYAKLSWMNEITEERNYSKAAAALKSAESLEDGLWAKKIELSISKLAILAAGEQDGDLELSFKEAKEIDRTLVPIKIQEQLSNYVRYVIEGAIDDGAAVQLAMSSLGHGFVNGKPTFHGILKQNITKVISHQALNSEELIDTLTLIDENTQNPDSEDFANTRFFHAIRLLEACPDQTPESYALQENIIWRRCLIQDDWEKLNRTEKKTDEEAIAAMDATALFKTLKAGFRHGIFNSLLFPIVSHEHDS